MNVTFETKAAEQVYKRVIANTAPAVKSNVDSMFEWYSRMNSEMGDGRVDGWYDNTVDEKEALAVEAALKRHDVITRNALGIGSYDANEVKQTLNDPEVVWWKILAEDFTNQDIKALETFIMNNPKSSRLPEAYYWLAHLQAIKCDTKEVILTNEKIVKLFPNSTQASEALNDLIPLYHQTGEDKKAFAAAELWLKKPEYPQRAFYYKPASYETVRNGVLFFQGEYYQAQGLKGKARAIYSRIISGKEKKDTVLAQGAIDFLKATPKITPKRVKYIEYKLNLLRERAEYYHYDRRDYKTAAEIYRKILKLSAAVIEGLDELYISAESSLVEIELRKVKTSIEAFKAIEELNKKGGIIPFLRYYTRISEWDNISGIPPKSYLLFYLLKSCKDVQEVRLAMATRIEKIDRETKSPKKIYWIIYKTEEGWQTADINGLKYKAESLDKAVQHLEREAKTRVYSVPSKKSFFPGSLREFNRSSRLSPGEVALELEQTSLFEAPKQMVQQMLQSIKTKFNGEGEEAREKLATFARAFSILPKSHFRGLASVYFDKKMKKGVCGEYYHNNKSINLACSDSRTAVHEIAHHWDFHVARGKDGGDQTAGDPSLIFYRISWDKWSLYSCAAQPDKPCTGWKLKSNAKEDDFSRNYGKRDGFEDKATSFESYVERTFGPTRNQVREQMRQGNFAPAAKYIFNKYVESYDEEDGLCFEYNLTRYDPPLSLQEVKKALARWLATHPGSVHNDVLTSLRMSEEWYLEQRKKLFKQ